MGLTEQLDEVNKKLTELKEGEVKKGKKPKKFKLPSKGKVSNSKARKGYVTIFKINENNVLTIDREQIQEQTTIVDGVPRLATPDHVLTYKGKPAIIQPSWSTEPFSSKQHFQASLENGSNIAGHKLILNRMKLSSADGQKKKMSGMVGWIIGGIVLAIIGYAFYTGGI